MYAACRKKEQHLNTLHIPVNIYATTQNIDCVPVNIYATTQNLNCVPINLYATTQNIGCVPVNIYATIQNIGFVPVNIYTTTWSNSVNHKLITMQGNWRTKDNNDEAAS